MQFITDNPADSYATSDFLEICYLLAKNAKLVSATRDAQIDRVVFAFFDNQACKKLIYDLTLGNDEVSASRFMEAIRRTKKLIQTNR